MLLVAGAVGLLAVGAVAVVAVLLVADAAVLLGEPVEISKKKHFGLVKI